ncbi:cysteine-rich CWC family protein [Rhodoferax sp. OV413]|uniref:cysteine-rich CWC family protein n=1 Tax=Rhodoferax sp. OV413 TaxID=1855285 RepID=UPI000B81B66B|nr:cysteine-rich CWC family protein [Rhodoferax sp. OV413]
MSSAVDPRYCPLCGQPNQCAMELARSTGLPPGPCWCMQQSIAPETLAQIDPAALDRACLCPRCAALPANNSSQPTSPTS